MAQRVNIKASDIRAGDYIPNFGVVSHVKIDDIETDGDELVMVYFNPISLQQFETLEVIR